MDHVHSGFNRRAIDSDESVSTSDTKSSTSFYDDDGTPAIIGVDNDDVSVTGDCAPLPLDMVVAIGEHLRVPDWPRLFSTNRAISALYRANQIGYAKSLGMIGSAMRFSEIKEAMTAITQYPTDKQPYLLRALAENVRMRTHGAMYGATAEWADAIDAQFHWHEAQPDSTERNVALQQLIIARGFALTESHFSREGEDLQSIIGERLNKLYPENWPPIFEAFMPCDEVQNLLQHCHFTEKFKGYIPAISPEFALMIAVECLYRSDEYAALSGLLCDRLRILSTLLRERFRISDACMRDVLDPLIADTIVEAAIQVPAHLRNGWIKMAAQQWPLSGGDFISLVTDAFLRSFDEKVYRCESFSFLLNEDFSELPDLEHRARRRTMSFESPTILALRDTEEYAEEQIDAFLKIIDRIGNRPGQGVYIATLREIVGMPLVGRPALLHRLVSNAQIGGNPLMASLFIEAATDCRNALISGNASNSPLICRVSAALILIANAMRRYDASAADAIVAEAGELAFLHSAEEDWGDVLQALIFESLGGHPVAVEKSAHIDRHIGLFVCLPNTSALHLPDLADRIEKMVGTVWRQLPDKATDTHSRFEVFRQRIGIKPSKGDVAFTSIAESLVSEVVPGAHFLEDVASENGFDDPDAIGAMETALFKIKIRPILRADSDVDVITEQYTKRSLYLRSLIAQAVHDLA